MGRYVVEKSARSASAPSVLYGLLRDGSTWPSWSQIDSFELEREGSGEPEGPGAIRVLTSGRIVGRDEVLGFVENKQFRYAHLGGLPVRDYRGTVDLEAVDGGTVVTWRVTFDAKYPGTGWLVRRMINTLIERVVNGLANHSTVG